MNLATGIAVIILFLIPIRVVPACSALSKGGWGGLLAVRLQNDPAQGSSPISLGTTPVLHGEYVKNEMNGHVMEITGQKSQFRRIKQPPELKLAVTLGGLALIGLEVWWFLLSQTVSTTDKNR